MSDRIDKDELIERIARRTGNRVFKFNASQRLRKLFGWTSSYKGEL